MFSWAALAAAALGYLGTIAINPDGLSRLTKPLQSDQESNRAELDRAQLTAQVRSLRDTVASLRDDLARLSEQRTTTAALSPSEPPIPPVVPKLSDDASSTTNSVAADDQLPETSDVRTGSISSGTTATEKTASSPRDNTVSTSDANAPTANIQPSIINGPAGSNDAAPGAATTTTSQPKVAATKPAPVAAPEVKRPKRNLAISPLRPGRLPPVPGHLPRQASSMNDGITASPGDGPYQPILENNRTSSRANQVSSQARKAVRTASAASNAVKPRPVRTIPLTNSRAPTQPPNRTSALTRSQIQSGQIAKPVAFGTPKVTTRRPPPKRSPAALSLSSASSVTGLRASWLLLTTSHGRTLSGYQPRFVRNAANNNYRLIAGPIASRFEADRVCTSLRIQGVSCGVTDFGGTPF